MSTSSKRLDALDGLRALAIFLVLSFHYWQQSWISTCITIGKFQIDLSIPVSQGSFGVTLLFAISGFGLYYSSRPGKPFSLGTYIKKRCARILPTYWICVLVSAAYQIGRLAPATLKEQFIANMTLTQMMTPSVSYNMLNGALWSLAIEAQFYVVFPLIRMWFKRHPYLITAAAYVLAQLWRTWRGVYCYEDNLWYFANQLPGWIDVFVSGMLAAHIVVSLQDTLTDEQREKLAPAASALLFAGLAVIYLTMRYRFVNRYDDLPENTTRLELTMRAFIALGSCMALVGCAFPNRLAHACLGNRLARFLGGISYQVYMWHMFIALRLKELRIPDYTTERAMDDLAWRPKYVLLSLVLTLIVSIAMTYLAERPLSKLLLRPRKKEKDHEEKGKV